MAQESQGADAGQVPRIGGALCDEFFFGTWQSLDTVNKIDFIMANKRDIFREVSVSEDCGGWDVWSGPR